MRSNNTIFRQGSKTFYTASLFFPKRIRRDVTRLYAFVRIADNFVDQIPQDKHGFLKFKKQTEQAFISSVKDDVINDFILLCREYRIEKKWVDSFLAAMEQDLTKSKYYTYRELEEYMYGWETSGLDRLIQTAYKKLGLISFLTSGIIEVKAWTIRKGTLAPQAAGVIHTDFEKKFIKADIVSYTDFVTLGGWGKARIAGKARMEGKEYEMKDGDVVEFKIGS